MDIEDITIKKERKWIYVYRHVSRYDKKHVTHEIMYYQDICPRTVHWINRMTFGYSAKNSNPTPLGYSPVFLIR